MSRYPGTIMITKKTCLPITLILTFLFLILPNSALFAQDLPELRLDDLIKEALTNNPGIKAARYQTLSEKTKIGQVKAWEPPQVGVEFAQTPLNSFPVPMNKTMETDYFIQQKFPFPGKIPAMARSMESSAAMSEYAVKAVENAVIRDIKNAYYDLCLIQQKIKINGETQNLMREFSDIAKRQYEVGLGIQADVLRAQTELSMLINEGNNLEQEKKINEAMINSILGRPSDQTLGRVPDIGNDILPEITDDPTALALKNRPELNAMTKNIDMKKSELDAAKREYYPDIMVRLMYKSMRESEDYWSTMISVDIPFFFLSGGKIKGKVEESEVGVMKAKEDYRTMENMTRFQIREAAANARTSRNTMSLYKFTVIPQAEQTVESTKAAYQTGKAEIFSLIEASRTLRQIRLDYYTAVTQYMRSLTVLEQIAGADIKKQ